MITSLNYLVRARQRNPLPEAKITNAVRIGHELEFVEKVRLGQVGK